MAHEQIFFALAVLAGLAVYVWLGRRIAARGGKVASDKLGTPDLLMGWALVNWFGLLMTASARRPRPHAVHTRDVIHSALMETLLVAVICGFLRYRGIRLREFFGLRRTPPGKTLGLAILFLFAAYPLIDLASLPFGKGRPQEIVQFFLETLLQPDRRPVIITLTMGVLIAPVAEELIFRGYIYPIVKRYLGIVAGVAVNSALFAAIHMDKQALLPLFTLAVCFSLVYEATGSLLVSATMHSLFNLNTFLALAAMARAHLL